MQKGQPGETYIIAGARHKLTEVFDLAEQITGIPAPKIKIGPGTMKSMSKIMKGIGTIFPLPAEYTAESLRGMAGTIYLRSNEKAKRELGYSVRPLHEGLKDTLFFWMKEMDIHRPIVPFSSL